MIVFEKIASFKGLYNILSAECDIKQHYTFPIILEEAIHKKDFDNNPTQYINKHAIFIYIRYKGLSPFSLKEKNCKSFYFLQGKSLTAITSNQFKEINCEIPQEFNL